MNATDVIAEVKAKLNKVSSLEGKVVVVYDQNNLGDKLKGVKFPAAGLIYDGMRSLPEQGATAKVGLSAELVISIVLVMQPETLFNADAKTPIIVLLDEVRSMMMSTRSVTGHFWHFLVEAPAEVQHGMAFWVQRWSTPIQLPRKTA